MWLNGKGAGLKIRFTGNVSQVRILLPPGPITVGPGGFYYFSKRGNGNRAPTLSHFPDLVKRQPRNQVAQLIPSRGVNLNLFLPGPGAGMVD